MKLSDRADLWVHRFWHKTIAQNVITPGGEIKRGYTYAMRGG